MTEIVVTETVKKTTHKELVLDEEMLTRLLQEYAAEKMGVLPENVNVSWQENSYGYTLDVVLSYAHTVETQNAVE